MEGMRQNFALPYPIVRELIEVVSGHNAYKLSKTCQLLERLSHKHLIPDFPTKMCSYILEKASPSVIHEIAQSSKFLSDVTAERRGRPVNVLSIDDESQTECFFNEYKNIFCLTINAEDYEPIIKHLVVTDTLEIYSCRDFQPSLRKALHMPTLQFTKLELIGCTIGKEDLKYFVHRNLAKFYTENTIIEPPVTFSEFLEMTVNVEKFRIDIPSLKVPPNVPDLALSWERKKPIKKFAFMRLSKYFSVSTCTSFIEKFGGENSEFHVSFHRGDARYHDRYRMKVQEAINEAQNQDRSDRSNNGGKLNGLRGVIRWRCMPLEY